MSQLKYWDGTAWVDAIIGAQGANGVQGVQGLQGAAGISASDATVLALSFLGMGA